MGQQQKEVAVDGISQFSRTRHLEVDTSLSVFESLEGMGRSRRGCSSKGLVKWPSSRKCTPRPNRRW